MDYHLTKFVTGHGCFRAYLLQFRHVAQCLYCPDAKETVEYVSMYCSMFTPEREQLRALTGNSLNVRGLFAAMMANSDAWELGQRIIVNMMK